MQFRFEIIEYDKTLPSLPKHSGVYKIFDLRGKLIVLDKTSNLFERFERYYGERSERVRDLDLREITGRIEYIRTDSTFETLYVLYRERKNHFPKTYLNQAQATVGDCIVYYEPRRQGANAAGRGGRQV